MHRFRVAIILFSALVLIMPISASDLSAVESQVSEALVAEKAGFNARDCDAALKYWSEEAFMIVEGAVRARTRADLAKMCPRIMAGLPPELDNRDTQEEAVYGLSETSAFTMTHYMDGAVVTKIWRKFDEGWRIVNMHESVGNGAQPGPKPKRKP